WRIIDVVPKTYRNHHIKLPVGPPVEHVRLKEFAALDHSFARAKSLGKFQHFRGHVDAGDVVCSTLCQGSGKPAGATTNVADRLSSNVTSLLHYPLEPLENVTSEPLVSDAGEAVLLAGVDCVE